MKTLADTLRALAEGATEGPWRVGRQDGAPRDHLVDMGEPPKAPYFRMHKGVPASSITRGMPAFGIVESDDAEAEEIAANAALIVALRNALPTILNALDEHDALTARVAGLTEAVRQYRNDLMFPVAPDSKERRLAMIDKLLTAEGGQ